MAPCEWVIDIIKEWVIAQAYATMAWVMDWVTPVHISGALDPNVNCTYHKGGMLNGKPWYVREDGEWFIWWDGGAVWYINGVLGIDSPPRWIRHSPSVLGEYIPQPPDGGPATVNSGYGCPKLCFVNRGDPAANDYAVGDFTKDGTWYDLNLSAIVPAGTKAVAVKLGIGSGFAGAKAAFRTNGNVNTFNMSLASTQAGGIFLWLDIIIPVDSDRKIEYNFDAGFWTLASFTVKGWWL